MILLNFQRYQQFCLGVKTEKGILDVEKASHRFPNLKDVPHTTMQLIQSGELGKKAIEQLTSHAYQDDALFLSEDQLQIGPSVPEPTKIICIGLNYKKHADECNMVYPPAPIIFSKFNNSIAAHQEDIPIPIPSAQMDYEGELAIIIGQEAKNVRTEEALSYVYGYCNANDVSARDFQFKSSQWLLGKTCDGFCPIGPYLVTADEIKNPNQLEVTTRVNGEVRQHSNTCDMIFYCDEIISYISQHMTLYPGDVILTGTPEGVIVGYPEENRIWLKAGDEVSVEIEKLGQLSNRLV